MTPPIVFQCLSRMNPFAAISSIKWYQTQQSINSIITGSFLIFTIFLLSSATIPVFLSGQITTVGTATTNTSTNGSVSVNKPTGIQVGDIMLANIVQHNADGGDDLTANATSSGWTQLAAAEFSTSNDPEYRGTILYKIAVASDVSATSYTFTGTGNTSVASTIGAIIAFRGVNNANPFDGVGTLTTGNADDLTAASITTTTANTAVIMFGMVGDDRNYSGWGTGAPGNLTFNESYDITSTAGDDSSIGAAWVIKPGTGATGTGTSELSGNENDFFASMMVALRACTPPVVAPVNGGASLVCIGQMTPAFTNATPGGVWSSSNTAIATINGSGIATGVAAGNVNIIYTVTDASGCSASATRALVVSSNSPAAGAISGNTAGCPNSTGHIFSVPNVAGTTYNWSITGGAGFAITSGQGTNQVTVSYGSTFPQTLSVTATNSCGTGPASSVSITGGVAPFCTNCTSCTDVPVDPNPVLAASCANMKVALLIDESFSVISPIDYTDEIEDGILSLLNALSCTGAQVAIAEFAIVSNKLTSNYVYVDQTLINAVQQYFNGTPNALLNNQTYAPGNGTAGTNYQAGLMAINDYAGVAPDLLLLVTDGVPTYFTNSSTVYNNSANSVNCPPGGPGNPLGTASVENAARLTNYFKCRGTHIFGVGVGLDVIGEDVFGQISGTVEYSQGNNTIANSDFTNGDFDQLAASLSNFITQLCPFNTSASGQDICTNGGGSNGTITVEIPSEFLAAGFAYAVRNSSNVIVASGSNIMTSPYVINDPDLIAGTYTVTITYSPAPGCTRTISFEVTIEANAVPPMAIIPASGGLVQPTCQSPNSGAVTLQVTQGESPYTATLYSGTPPANPPYGTPIDGPDNFVTSSYSFTGLSGGNYFITMTDHNHCDTVVLPFMLNVPQNCCVAPASITAPNTCTTSANVFFTQNGGTPGGTWSVSGGGTINAASGEFDPGNTPGCYTTTYTMMTCSLTVNFIVFPAAPAAPVVNTGCGASVTVTPPAAQAGFNIEYNYGDGTGWLASNMHTYSVESCSGFQIRTRYVRATTCGSYPVGTSLACAESPATNRIVDITNPTASNPAPVNVQCIADIPEPNVAVVVGEADNCTAVPTVTFINDQNNGGTGCPGSPYIVTRTYRVTDACGNSTNVTQTITALDNTPPTASNPAPVNVQCIADVPAPNVAVVVDEADNCTAVPTVTYINDQNNGGTGCPGSPYIVSRTYRVTDNCGNSTNVTQTITVVDNTPPTASNPAPVNVECIADIPAPDVSVVTNEADNCTAVPVVTYINDQNNGGTGCPGSPFIVSRTYRVTDACGNSTNVTQTITIVDNTPPTASNPAPVNVQCIAEIPVPDETVVTNEADNCTAIPTVTFVNDQNNGGTGCAGNPYIVSRTYRVTDNCGNSTNVTQTITVIDNIPPTASNPAPVNVQCITDVPAPNVDVVTDEADNCTAVPVVTYINDQNNGGAGCPGNPYIVTRMYQVSDACGNSTQVTQTITVVDNTAPVFVVCPENVTISCSESTSIASLGDASASDNCDLSPEVSSNDVSTRGNDPEMCNFYTYTITRTFTAVDDCNNVNSCTQIITVQDIIAPTITFCPADITVECGDATSIAALGSATATDNCDATPVVSHDDNSTQGMDPESCDFTITRTFTAIDACGNSSSCTQVITVLPGNMPPIANRDDETTDEETPVIIIVHANDMDVDDPLGTPTITEQPSNGTVTVNGDNTITYTPNMDFVGIDTFVYQICDPEPLCDTALVVIVVNPVNDPPIANPDTEETDEDTPVIIVVHSNDMDVDDPLGTPTITEQPDNGTVTVNPDNTITYIPDPQFVGQDTFVYQICDPEPLCDTALVIVIVNPVPDTIYETIPEDDTYTVCAEELTTFTVPAEDISLCELPSNGVLTVMNGCVTYDPNENFTGMDTFCVYVCHPNDPNLCDTTTVIITVTPINDPPIANPDTEETDEDTPVIIVVHSNDMDVDDPLGTPTITEQPDNGTVAVNPDNTITYIPDPQFVGQDTFVYQICDPEPLCDTALVIVIVHPVPDTIYETIPEDETYTVCAEELTTFTVPAEDISLCDLPSNGVLTVMNGCVTYDPNENFTGMDTFCVYVCHPNDPNLCDTTTVIITVTPINDPPIANPDTEETDEDTPVIIVVHSNDMDVDDPLGTPTITEQPDNGTVTVNPDNTITYIPDPQFVGQDTFVYQICDPEPLCDTALVIVIVNPVPDTIYETIPEDDTYTVCAEELTTFTVPAEDISLCDQPSNGVLTVMNGCVTYDPNENFTGMDTFCVYVCHPNDPNLCDTTTVIITVTPINDPPIANPDMEVTDQNTPVVVIVHANDMDVDDPLGTPTITEQPSHGSVVVNGDNTITYIPEPTFVGMDTFVYQICDPEPLCDTALVIITIEPLDPPMIACPDDVTIQCDDAQDISVLGEAMATSDCEGMITITHADESTQGMDTEACDYYSYTITRTFTAEDICGNTATCTQVITVRDVTAPTFTGPEDITISKDDVCGFDASLAITGTLTDIDDNCDLTPAVDFVDATVAGSCEGELIITRTFTIMDACGNSATDVQVITAIDDTPPTFTVPDNITIAKDEDCMYDAGILITGDVTDEADNCDTSLDATFDDAMMPGTCEEEILITRTWTLTDDCGNNTQETQLITVRDMTAPVMVGPDDITVTCSTSLPAAPVAIAEFLAMNNTSAADNCTPTDELTLNVVTGPLSGTNCDGSVVRTYTITDACGNATSATQTITIRDDVDPVITPAVIEDCYATMAQARQAALAVTIASDNCTATGNLMFVVTSGPGLSCDSMITVTVSDMCGNSASATYETMINCQAIRLKVYLEGVYNTTADTMRSTLNNNHALPGQISPSPFIFDAPAGQPYTVAPWNYTGNMGTAFGDGGLTPYPSSVVDWILVSVRENGIMPANTIWTCAGWVHKDGTVTFPESCPMPAIDITHDYYFVVQHRTHLGIMTPSFADINCNGAYLYWDFTTSDSYKPIFRVGQKQLSNGKWVMFGGNGNHTLSIQAINSPDRTTWKEWQGFLGYNPGDYDMNVSTNSADETLWKLNQNRTSGVIFY